MGSLVKLDVQTPALPTQTFAVATVGSMEDFERAAVNVQAAQALLKQMEDKRVELKKPILDAQRGLDGFFKTFSDPVSAFVAGQKTEMLRFKQEQDRIAAEQQRAADALAAEERARLQAEAEAALASGDIEQAEALATVAEVVHAPVVQSTVQKVAGISTRKVWKAEVTDKAKFVAAAASNPMFLAAIEVIEQTLANLAKSTDGKVEIPGVRLYQEEGMSARRAA